MTRLRHAEYLWCLVIAVFLALSLPLNLRLTLSPTASSTISSSFNAALLDIPPRTTSSVRYNKKEDIQKLNPFRNRTKIPRVCDECQKASVNTTTTCAETIYNSLPLPQYSVNLTIDVLVKVQTEISEQLQACQHACAPSNCIAVIDVDVGFDEAAPPLVRAVTPWLRSLPSKYQVPADVMKNETLVQAWFNDSTKFPPGHHLLHTFNPSLVAAPAYLTAQVENAAYIASFRLSPASGCMGHLYSFWDFNQVSYLGLALLDAQLEVIRDVVLNVTAWAINTTRRKPDKLRIEDVRFFYLTFPGQEEKLYMTFENKLVPVYITTQQERKAGYEYRVPPMAGVVEDPLYMYAPKDGLSMIEYGKLFPSTNPKQKGMKGRGAKNLQFFQDPDSDAVLIEDWPDGPREVREVVLQDELNFGFKYTSRNTTSYETNQGHFASFEGLERVLKERSRESACCIKLPRKYYENLVQPNHSSLDHDHLFFGISHFKTGGNRKLRTRSRREQAYLTRLYAFVPHAPFPLVARSGLFCFGFTQEDEDTRDPFALPSSVIPRNKTLYLGAPYNHCPRIEFVTGMTQVVGDESKVIVGYGINDCSSRLVVIEKRAIAEKLFLPLLGKEAHSSFL